MATGGRRGSGTAARTDPLRVATPAHVAGAILVQASGEADLVTGPLPVDDGMLA